MGADRARARVDLGRLSTRRRDGRGRSDCGPVYRAAGEHAGRWVAVTVWESREAEERFRETRLMPAVAATLAQGSAEGGPPPDERFEVQAIREP